MNLLKSTRSMTAATFTVLTFFVGYAAPTIMGLDASAHAAAPASKLGDLTPFRNLVKDVSTQVNKGDLVAAKKSITALELAWDGAEAGIKPRSAADWHLIDKALDKLYNAVRQDKLDAAACKQALVDVLATMDKADGLAH